MLEQLPDADERVDPNGQQVGVDAQLLDARQQRVLHRLVVEQPYR